MDPSPARFLGMFLQCRMELSVQLSFRKLVFGVYVSVQFRDGKLRISVVWVKRVGQKRPQEVFG